MSQSTHFAPRGIRAPSHLVEWARAEIERLGDDAFARRLGISRTPPLRVAAGLSATRGVIAVLQDDYEKHGPHTRAA